MNAKSLVLALTFTLAGAASAVAQDATAAPAEKRYHMNGKVVSVRPASGTAVIDHKAIPGYMGAMAMPYSFRDSLELSKLKAGDHITADVVVANSKTWIEKVVVVKDSVKAGT